MLVLRSVVRNTKITQQPGKKVWRGAGESKGLQEKDNNKKQKVAKKNIYIQSGLQESNQDKKMVSLMHQELVMKHKPKTMQETGIWQCQQQRTGYVYSVDWKAIAEDRHTVVYNTKTTWIKKQVANVVSIEGQEEGNKGTEDAHVKNS